MRVFSGVGEIVSADLRASSNYLVLSHLMYFSRYERSAGPVLAFAYITKRTDSGLNCSLKPA